MLKVLFTEIIVLKQRFFLTNGQNECNIDLSILREDTVMFGNACFYFYYFTMDCLPSFKTVAE